MYKSIMVPIDFAHANDIQRGLNVACDLAQHYGAELCIVGVTATAPTFSARSPREMATKLDALAETLTDRHGIPVTTKTVISHDPAVDHRYFLCAAQHNLRRTHRAFRFYRALNARVIKSCAERTCHKIVRCTHVS